MKKIPSERARVHAGSFQFPPMVCIINVILRNAELRAKRNIQTCTDVHIITFLPARLRSRVPQLLSLGIARYATAHCNRLMRGHLLKGALKCCLGYPFGIITEMSDFDSLQLLLSRYAIIGEITVAVIMRLFLFRNIAKRGKIYL